MRAAGATALLVLLLAACVGAEEAPALPRLLELGSDKCVPCKMMKPILDELESTCEGLLQVDFIDIKKQREAAKPYKVRIMPTQIFFSAEGEELWRHEGFLPREDIAAKWAEFGLELPPAPAGEDE